MKDNDTSHWFFMKCVDCNAFQLTICIEYEIKTREVGKEGIEGNKIVNHDPAVLSE